MGNHDKMLGPSNAVDFLDVHVKIIPAFGAHELIGIHTSHEWLVLLLTSSHSYTWTRFAVTVSCYYRIIATSFFRGVPPLAC